MSLELDTFIEKLKAEGLSLQSIDEAVTKQKIVLRILNLLGWDIYETDEVTPEFPVEQKNVDYALRISNTNKVFIEVKRVREELEVHQEQLLNYSYRAGVKLSVLTNGVTWWFYLPLYEGSWAQRHFYTIDIIEQDTQDVVSKFTTFLARKNIVNGDAYENAENIIKNKKNQKKLEMSVVKAWNKMINESDESLIEFIIDKTEKLSGLKTDAIFVGKFLVRNKEHFSLQERLSEMTRERRDKPITSRTSSQDQTNFSGKTPTAFSLKGIRCEIRSWKDMLTNLSCLVNEQQGKNFSKVLELSGRKRPYFSKNLNELRAPVRVGQSEIFVETNMSANFIVKICKEILTLFDYLDTDLNIETR